MSQSDVQNISCHDCDESVEISAQPQIDQVFFCNNCGAELLITQTEPELEYEIREEDK